MIASIASAIERLFDAGRGSGTRGMSLLGNDAIAPALVTMMVCCEYD